MRQPLVQNLRVPRFGVLVLALGLAAGVATSSAALASPPDKLAAPGRAIDGAGPVGAHARGDVQHPPGAGEDAVFDLDRMAAAIGSLRADVIGPQEVDVHWADLRAFVDEAGELAHRLRMHVFFAPIYDLDPLAPGAERRRHGVAILSRCPVVQAENHEITRLSTQVPDPVPAPAPGFPEATLNVHGIRVHFYTTHLDYRPDPSVRVAQVADMLHILAADAGPKILVGDLNAEPEATELATLWQTLRDAAPHGDDTYPAVTPAQRIDLVTVSPDVTVQWAKVVETVASDHRPVVVDVSVRGRSR